jgi:hypothetical protein
MRIGPLAVTALLLLAAPAPASAITLDNGAARFWLGGTIDSGDVPGDSLCDIAAPCPTWPLRLGPGGYRLRVGIDTPVRTDSFTIEVLDPSGAVAASSAMFNQFDAEAFVSKPAAGAWKVRVVPQGVSHAFFRLRAKLESAPEPKPAGHVPLLPNLKAVPPFEFGFVAPANPLNGLYPPDTANPPASVAGQEPISCAPDESAPAAIGGFDAKECLRFTTGPINVGDGPFVKLFTFAQDVASGANAPPLLRGPARQRIYWSDGTTTERPAGTYSFHTTHGHFHDDGILTYELFSVVGGPGGKELRPAGHGTKSGFCPADQLFGEWRRFSQSRAGDFGNGDTPTGNCFSPNDGTLSLTRGWGDVYRWQRPGQYVEFTGNGNGYYVLRATVDKSNTTLETNENDNSSYALIRITGHHVEVIERGQGQSHLDPNKVVFTGYGPASQDPYGEMPEPPSAATRSAASPRAARGRAPRVTAVRLRGRTLLFQVRAPATVQVSVVHAGRVVVRRTVRAAGGRVATIRFARLPAGRYRVALVAHDAVGRYGRPVVRAVRIGP